VSRLIWCSGKVYYDLTNHPLSAEQTSVAIARSSSFTRSAPMISRRSSAAIPICAKSSGSKRNRKIWAPGSLCSPTLKPSWPVAALRYMGRPPNASPAEGSSALHALHQAALVEQAYALPVEAGAR
jgi:2-oxoglutarate dehydrogenase E1 component